MEPTPNAPPTRPPSGLLPWLLWSLLLGAWTFALLWPEAHRVGEVVLQLNSKKFWVAKALHLSAYAFLAFLVWWLPARRGVRPAVWLSLVAHGALTEFLQNFVERDGNVYDVALDSA